MQFLECFASLKGLMLTEIYWVDLNPPDARTISPTFCSKLRTLEVSHNLIEGPLLNLMPASIERLAIGPRMEHRSDEDPPESYEGLARYRSLQTLHLETSLQDDIEWTPLFVRTIASSPALGALVKDLYIYLQDTQALWSSNDEDMAALFPAEATRNLSSLRHLTIDCELDLPPLKMSSICPSSIALYGRVQTLLFSGVLVDRIHDLMQFLEFFASLRTLTLTDIQWVDLDPPDAMTVSLTLPRLQTLHVYSNMMDGPILQLLPVSVESLSIGPRFDSELRSEEEFTDSFEGLARYQNLQTLYLETFLSDDIEWLVEALSFVRSPGLRTLSLVYNGRLSREFYRQMQAPRLRDLLAQEPFLNLALLHISIPRFNGTDEEVAPRKIQDFLESMFDADREGAFRPSYALKIKMC
ncbi:hypothetical protein BN946_scf184970.g22 [Trametes cinnabarina]|uniref:F-box domain-containing protein n=1 Tax=Pycnoporus cinnabarinus TaxID=5643 RepID=A0A060SCT1_PYCCI|nr:hypothetical protein BN946_scf184970.g22 [Trametes cinnabarina]